MISSKSSFFQYTLIAASALLLLLLGYQSGTRMLSHNATESTRWASTVDTPDKAERNAARADYFHRMLQDPETGRIPANVRSREIAFAREMPAKEDVKFKGSSATINWSAIGPNDVGGRTRALAFDITNTDVVVAGGVSGGVWKSTDSGQTWELKTETTQSQSVTSIAQDPRSGHTDTWYYVSGEYTGSSAADQGYRAFYYGTGVFKSTDNGETWSLLSDTEDFDDSFSSPFDYMSRVEVNPSTGSVYIASNGFGILRSMDGSNFEDTPVLGGRGEHLFADLDIAQDGTIVTVLSGRDAGVSSNDPGIFYSRDDGDTWSEIPASTLTDDGNYERSVVEIAPSNTDIAYVLTYSGDGSGQNETVYFHKINLENGTSEDRSANIPDYDSGDETDYLNTQSGYNMQVAVHPNDENFVIIGGTNLYRSTDGFATEAESNSKDAYWIGGYTQSNDGFSSYSNHHPDQHIVAFNPDNPNVAWNGNDGGLYKTDDITAEPVSWDDMNNGYNVTQFYTITIPDEANDGRIMGGTQDNGNPYFDYNSLTGSDKSTDAAGGDGAYDYFGDQYAFNSLQNGSVLRIDYGADGSPSTLIGWAYIHPSGASNQLFIHPYDIDPNNENVMVYPGGNNLWHNTEINNIDNQEADGATKGWSIPQGWRDFGGSGYNISAVEFSRSNPQHRLYFGASAQDDGSGAGEFPKIFKLDSAHQTTNTPTEVSIDTTLTSSGAYVHDIAINPEDANEAIVVLSNYNVPSLFHTTNGGDSWTYIEGNLASSEQVIGPSVRSATILPGAESTLYVVGTSAGVYTTTSLSGDQTSWSLESSGKIGYAIANSITSRISDGTIAVGSHGRGIFLGQVNDNFLPIAEQGSKSEPSDFALKANYPNPFNPTTQIDYTLSHPSNVHLRVYNTNGQLVKELITGKKQAPGSYSITFNAENLSSGVYFYKLEAEPVANQKGSFTQTRKMTLVK